MYYKLLNINFEKLESNHKTTLADAYNNFGKIFYD